MESNRSLHIGRHTARYGHRLVHRLCDIVHHFHCASCMQRSDTNPREIFSDRRSWTKTVSLTASVPVSPRTTPPASNPVLARQYTATPVECESTEVSLLVAVYSKDHEFAFTLWSTIPAGRYAFDTNAKQPMQKALIYERAMAMHNLAEHTQLRRLRVYLQPKANSFVRQLLFVNKQKQGFLPGLYELALKRPVSLYMPPEETTVCRAAGSQIVCYTPVPALFQAVKIWKIWRALNALTATPAGRFGFNQKARKIMDRGLIMHSLVESAQLRRIGVSLRSKPTSTGRHSEFLFNTEAKCILPGLGERSLAMYEETKVSPSAESQIVCYTSKFALFQAVKIWKIWRALNALTATPAGRFGFNQKARKIMDRGLIMHSLVESAQLRRIGVSLRSKPTSTERHSEFLFNTEAKCILPGLGEISLAMYEETKVSPSAESQIVCYTSKFALFQAVKIWKIWHALNALTATPAGRFGFNQKARKIMERYRALVKHRLDESAQLRRIDISERPKPTFTVPERYLEFVFNTEAKCILPGSGERSLKMYEERTVSPSAETQIVCYTSKFALFQAVQIWKIWHALNALTATPAGRFDFNQKAMKIIERYRALVKHSLAENAQLRRIDFSVRPKPTLTVPERYLAFVFNTETKCILPGSGERSLIMYEERTVSPSAETQIVCYTSKFALFQAVKIWNIWKALSTFTWTSRGRFGSNNEVRRNMDKERAVIMDNLVESPQLRRIGVSLRSRATSIVTGRLLMMFYNTQAQGILHCLGDISINMPEKTTASPANGSQIVCYTPKLALFQAAKLWKIWKALNVFNTTNDGRFGFNTEARKVMHRDLIMQNMLARVQQRSHRANLRSRGSIIATRRLLELFFNTQAQRFLPGSGQISLPKPVPINTPPDERNACTSNGFEIVCYTPYEAIFQVVNLWQIWKTLMVLKTIPAGEFTLNTKRKQNSKGTMHPERSLLMQNLLASGQVRRQDIILRSRVSTHQGRRLLEVFFSSQAQGFPSGSREISRHRNVSFHAPQRETTGFPRNQSQIVSYASDCSILQAVTLWKIWRIWRAFNSMRQGTDKIIDISTFTSQLGSKEPELATLFKERAVTRTPSNMIETLGESSGVRLPVPFRSNTSLAPINTVTRQGTPLACAECLTSDTLLKGRERDLFNPVPRRESEFEFTTQPRTAQLSMSESLPTSLFVDNDSTSKHGSNNRLMKTRTDTNMKAVAVCSGEHRTDSDSAVVPPSWLRNVNPEQELTVLDFDRPQPFADVRTQTTSRTPLQTIQLSDLQEHPSLALDAEGTSLPRTYSSKPLAISRDVPSAASVTRNTSLALANPVVQANGLSASKLTTQEFTPEETDRDSNKKGDEFVFNALPGSRQLSRYASLPSCDFLVRGVISKKVADDRLRENRSETDTKKVDLDSRICRSDSGSVVVPPSWYLNVNQQQRLRAPPSSLQECCQQELLPADVQEDHSSFQTTELPQLRTPHDSFQNLAVAKRMSWASRSNLSFASANSDNRQARQLASTEFLTNESTSYGRKRDLGNTESATEEHIQIIPLPGTFPLSRSTSVPKFAFVNRILISKDCSNTRLRENRSEADMKIVPHDTRIYRSESGRVVFPPSWFENVNQQQGIRAPPSSFVECGQQQPMHAALMDAILALQSRDDQELSVPVQVSPLTRSTLNTFQVQEVTEDVSWATLNSSYTSPNSCISSARGSASSPKSSQLTPPRRVPPEPGWFRKSLGGHLEFEEAINGSRNDSQSGVDLARKGGSSGDHVIMKSRSPRINLNTQKESYKSGNILSTESTSAINRQLLPLDKAGCHSSVSLGRPLQQISNPRLFYRWSSTSLANLGDLMKDYPFTICGPEDDKTGVASRSEYDSEQLDSNIPNLPESDPDSYSLQSRLNSVQNSEPPGGNVTTANSLPSSSGLRLSTFTINPWPRRSYEQILSTGQALPGKTPPVLNYTDPMGFKVPKVVVPFVEDEDIQFDTTVDGEHVVLGQGTYGAVESAKYTRPDGQVVDVAVKKYLESDDFPEIIREAKMLEFLGLTHVFPTFYGFADIADVGERPRLCLVSELFGGGKTLDAVLSRTNTDVTETGFIRIAIQLVKGMRLMHHKGVMYNDLKPNNVLVDTTCPDRPIIKYIDAGMCTLRQGVNYCPHDDDDPFPHLAPEARRGSSTTTYSDLWSLGVVFRQIARKKNINALGHIAEELLKEEPKDRLSLDGVTSALMALARLRGLL